MYTFSHGKLKCTFLHCCIFTRISSVDCLWNSVLAIKTYLSRVLFTEFVNKYRSERILKFNLLFFSMQDLLYFSWRKLFFLSVKTSFRIYHSLAWSKTFIETNVYICTVLYVNDHWVKFDLWFMYDNVAHFSVTWRWSYKLIYIFGFFFQNRLKF